MIPVVSILGTVTTAEVFVLYSALVRSQQAVLVRITLGADVSVPAGLGTLSLLPEPQGTWS